MKHFLTAFLCAIALACSAYGDNRILNDGNFEHGTIAADSPWKISGSAGVEQVSGAWKRFTCTFNSIQHQEARFQFYVLKGSIGTVWIDNIAITEAATGTPVMLQNAGFESGNAGAIPSWDSIDSARTISIDTERASEGKSSLRVTHINEAVPEGYIWQKFAVKPNTEYVAQFDIFISDNFQGDARGLIFDAEGKTCIVTNFGQAFANTLAQLRDRCGLYALKLAPAGEAAIVTQHINPESDQNLHIAFDLDNRDFDGKLQISLRSVTTGQTIASHEVDTAEPLWRRVPLACVSPGGELELQISADGNGTALVDNITVGPPEISPPLQDVTWGSASDNFILPANLKVAVAGPATDVVDGGLELLGKDLELLSVAIERVEGTDAQLMLSIDPSMPEGPGGDEAYTMQVTRDGIRISARHSSGVFYGLMTLCQLLDQRNGEVQAMACNISDYPDFPIRGVLFGDPEKAARWKMNTLMLSTGHPETPDDIKALETEIARLERMNLRVIPYFTTMTLGYYVTGKNPNYAAAIQVKGESLTLNGTTPTELAHKQVVRTKLTDITLTSRTGQTRYQLGRDYEIIDGDIRLPFNGDGRPFAVVRTARSRINDGATVLATYDYVDRFRASTNRAETHLPYVSVEPEARKMMGDFVESFAARFPSEYINVVNCLEEFGPVEAQLQTDSRVINSRRKPIDLVADEMIYLEKRAKAGDPNLKLIMWAGHVNAYSQSAGPRIPKSTMINIWGYDANWAEAYGREAIKYWSELGHETTVMPWNNLRNVRGWAQVAAEARKLGYPCLGIIDSCWPDQANPDAGMQESANVSWKLPVPGDSNYVELPAAK